MRLRSITELNIRRAVEAMSPLLGVMPRSKRKHSRRVAKSLNKAGAGPVGVYAGLLHDYLENGGDILTLSQHIQDLSLPKQIVDIVDILSSDEHTTEDSSNQPLAHLSQVLAQISDPALRNIVILAKLSDRLDNLTRRANRGKISKKYKFKSLELIEWLRYNYAGKNKPFNKLIKAINDIIPVVVFEPDQ